VIAALAGHQLGANQTIARVRDPDYFGPGDSFARDELGIDFLINPERATAEDLAEAILLPGAVHVEYFAQGRVAVAESILTERSPLLGLSLAERARVRPHSIIGIIRDGRAVPGEPGHRPRVGDHVLVAAAREDIRPVVANLAGRAQRVHEAVVFGGGRIGLPLARRLEESDEVRVTFMESDRERARYIAERLPGTTVLRGDEDGRPPGDRFPERRVRDAACDRLRLPQRGERLRRQSGRRQDQGRPRAHSQGRVRRGMTARPP